MPYSFHLNQFDGPLDLLLHLIQDAEVDIKDIFVSEITAQYLAYMSEVDTLDMDAASEFLDMAATLLYIKSRQLLPRPPKEDEEAGEDPEITLIRQLREYQVFKEAGADLGKLFMEAQKSFTRLPEDVLLPPQRVELDGATLDNLYAAFTAMLARAGDQAPSEAPRVRPDRYTVRNQMKKIREILVAQASVRFEDLFFQGADRMEVIVTFMAILEMLAHGEVTVKQRAPFEPIGIRAKSLLTDGDEAFDYMDEQD